MPLTRGTRLGHYSILSAIGAGGMGEVYLAEDERLRRRVALKVLPTHLSADEAAGKRLLREARSAATLSHPNICTVFEVGEADGRGFIAMQYVEGSTLAERLKKAPLELPVAITIGRQIADAVAEAHRRGIVHRDIKPQNIIVSGENQVTVLDFGLAKAVAPAEESSATVSRLTESGVVSGTAAYMSPEQARAEAVDERSDVFSFGIVLWEMIARAHPFAHDSWAETLTAILARDPRPIEAPIPAELRRILRKCLEKDRGRRYQTMKDVALDLESLAQEMSDARAVALAGSTGAPAARRRTRGRLWIAGAAMLAVAAAAAAIYVWRTSSGAPVQGGYEAITDFTDSATAPALSPDGRMVTFIRGGSWFMTRTGQIYVKMLPNGEAIRLTDDAHAKFGPVFSPDGTRIAYSAISVDESRPSWDTWTVPVSGGTPTRLLANASGLTWIDPRHVLFSEIQPGPTLHMGLVTATEDRRDARQVYLPTHERAMAHYSSLSPDRAWVLVVEMGPMGTFESCRLVPFDGRSASREVGPAGVCQAAAWSPDGRWMYFAAEVDGPSHLWRQRFPDGTPEPITSGPATEEEGVAVAPDGRSLITSIGIRQSSLWWHSEKGEHVLSSEGYAAMPRLTPDGTHLYYLLRRGSSPGVVELRVMDLASQKSERLLPDFSIVDYDVSRDGREIAVTVKAADRSLEIWVASMDRRTAPRRIVHGADSVGFGANRDLVFRSVEGHVNYIERIGLDGQNRVRLSDINAFGFIRVSPDGRWVSVAGRLPGDRVGVMLLPVYGGESRVMCYNGCRLDWSPDATSLYVLMGIESPNPVVILPLRPGQMFPEFPSDGGEALAAWRKLPGARVVDRPESIPGPDPSTYVITKSDERRNLFRVPLPR